MQLWSDDTLSTNQKNRICPFPQLRHHRIMPKSGMVPSSHLLTMEMKIFAQCTELNLAEGLSPGGNGAIDKMMMMKVWTALWQ